MKRDTVQDFIVVRWVIDQKDHDRATELLWAMETVGLQEEAIADSEPISITAFFDSASGLETFEDRMREAIEQYQICAESPVISIHREDPQQWIRSYRRTFREFAIDETFFVFPSWGQASSKHPVNLQIDPGHGFGTGTHESTQLALSALKETVPEISTLIDVGTGSGILVVAARMLSPRLRVIACDIDPLAVESARKNLRSNRVESVGLFVGGPSSLRSLFDCVVANLTLGIFRSISSHLCRLSARHLILSGFTFEQEALVLETFQIPTAFRVLSRGERNGWVCLHLER